jgi:deoxyribodipyrimidine photo-lyase
MIEPERVKALNRWAPREGRYVVYWMQASQRTEYNHALEYAIEKANELTQPVVAFFGITDHFPEANGRHYCFMLEGLKDAEVSLRTRGIKLVIRHESPESGVVKIGREASLVVVDRGYLRIQKHWREAAARALRCQVVQVESDVIVPVEVASPKEEYAAATIRPKIRKQLDRYLVPLKKSRPRKPSLGMDLESFDISDVGRAVSGLGVDRSVGRVESFRGGLREAKRRLRAFIRNRLDTFDEFRNDPTRDNLSNMSPYLHFGQISPLYIALEAIKSGSLGTAAFIEELIVRRELSMNFVFYNSQYDSFQSVPQWARKSLTRHRRDKRQYTYTLRELERAATHDPYWNAAQDEMRFTGKMHGYMRMYWGKKIIEWSPTPEDAYGIALYLNNKYELDGRDPNGFAGVAWCFGKHDRPWGEREVFGKVRYMNAAGLRRKFDADAYVERVTRMAKGSKP